MSVGSSWEDEVKQLGVIQIAGGLNKSLFIKGSGDCQVIKYQPTPDAVNATVTMSAANLMSGIITSTTAAAVTATLPTVVALAAYINAANVARSSSLLQVGSSFDFFVITTGANALTVATATGWTLVGDVVVAAGTSSHFRVRFTGVTVGAETATLYNLAVSA